MPSRPGLFHVDGSQRLSHANAGKWSVVTVLVGFGVGYFLGGSEPLIIVGVRLNFGYLVIVTICWHGFWG